jgi:hypothetical protein
MSANFSQSVLGSFVAGADLTANQWQAVKLDTTGAVVAVAAVTDIPVGVLQNAPKAGQSAEVLVIGGTKFKASAAIALPAVLGVDATGRAKKLAAGTDTTQYIIGQADAPASATGDIISAVVNFASPSRAA